MSTSSKPRRVRASWIIGILLAAAVIAAVEWLIGWIDIARAWRDVPPDQLALACGLAVLGYVLRAARLARVAGGVGVRASPLSWFRITAIHTCAINIVPARAGEAALPMLLHRHCAMPLGRGLGLLVTIRLHDLAAMTALGLAAAVMLLRGSVTGGLALAALIIAGWLGLLLLPRLVLPWTDRGPDWLARLAWPLRLLSHGLAGAYALTLGAWAAKWASLAIIAAAVAGLEPIQAAVAIGAAEAAALSPIQGVAGAGTFEAAVGAALVFTGLGAAEALHAAVVLHLFLLGVSLLLAAIAAPLPHRE